MEWKRPLTKAKERATCAGNCRSVSVSVQRYSVQYKGYNLIGVPSVDGGATRGTTALVYSVIHSSLFTRTVQGWYSTPKWFDHQPGVEPCLHKNEKISILSLKNLGKSSIMDENATKYTKQVPKWNLKCLKYLYIYIIMHAGILSYIQCVVKKVSLSFKY